MTKFSDDEIEEALRENHGLLHQTLAYLAGRADAQGRVVMKSDGSPTDIPVRMTREALRKRIQRSERLKSVKADMDEVTKDKAEECVFQVIQEGGHRAVRAATWFLERRAAERGYSIKQDLVASVAQEIIRYSLPDTNVDKDAWSRLAASHKGSPDVDDLGRKLPDDPVERRRAERAMERRRQTH